MSTGPVPPPQVPPPQVPPPPVPPPPLRRNTGMLILAYLGLLALVPLLTEKDDPEVQWHAKHGLVLCVAFFGVSMMLFVASSVIWPLWLLQPPLSLAYLVVVVLGILKATNGQRLVLPGLSDLVDRF